MTKIILNYVLFFVFMVLIKFIINNGNNKHKKYIKQFLDEELSNEFTKTKNIEEEIFYKPDISKIPIKNYNNSKYINIVNAQKKVIKNAKNKMILLDPPLSNKKLKLKYGNNNLKIIALYEKNYIEYIRSLNKLAEELISIKNYKDAQIILEETVNMKSLLFSSYSLLLDIYILNKDYEKIKNLKNKIQNTDLFNYDMFFKNKIISYLEKINFTSNMIYVIIYSYFFVNI